jgi:hypothetical protein
MHVSERNKREKLRTALMLSADDCDQAAAAACALDAATDNQALMLALEAAISVCYSRAFTQSSLLQLGAEHEPNPGTTDAQFHNYLRQRRDEAYAHTDKAGGRTNSMSVSLEGAGVVRVEWQSGWLPLPREYIAPIVELCNRQAERFRAQAAEIQLQLDAETRGLM